MEAEGKRDGTGREEDGPGCDDDGILGMQSGIRRGRLRRRRMRAVCDGGDDGDDDDDDGGGMERV